MREKLNTVFFPLAWIRMDMTPAEILVFCVFNSTEAGLWREP